MPGDWPKSKALFDRNRKSIPGGVVSLNRAVEPEISFVRGEGSRLWDLEGNEYIDYHAAFAPHLLGHNDPGVNAAVEEALRERRTLSGSGTTPWEGRLAELLVEHIASVDMVQLTNTGSEATYHAIRLARAYTGRDDIVVMQGGYNGWHNDVALNLMTPLEQLGPRQSSGSYERFPLSAGIPESVLKHVHAVNFNDVAAVEAVFERHSVACVIMEPILQNIGVVKPRPGYLEALRSLCDRYGALLVFDEVKTGFRHALGGYQSLCGVDPDISVFGKALANGYPMGAIGGRRSVMELFCSDDPARKVLIAGTYNSHPFTVAAAIATVERLAAEPEIYHRLDALGARMAHGLTEICRDVGVQGCVARQGSAFCLYFMDHEPVDWHDLAENHDMAVDLDYRRRLIVEGVYHFPAATKQGSVSAAHTDADIETTLERTRRVLRALVGTR